jgi:hypothetical protein
MLITKAPPAAPITINSPDVHLFMAANQPGVCYLPISGSSKLDMQLLNATATGTVKGNQPGTIEVGIFVHVAQVNEDPPSDTTGLWVMIGMCPPEPIAGADDLESTSWMVQGNNLMFNLETGKMQGAFQSNVADNPVFPADLNTNPNDIDRTQDPLFYFAVGARFTPDDDDGSTPELTMVNFMLTGEL